MGRVNDVVQECELLLERKIELLSQIGQHGQRKT